MYSSTWNLDHSESSGWDSQVFDILCMIILFDYIGYLITSGSFAHHDNYTARALFQVCLTHSFNTLHHIPIWVSVNWGLSQNRDLVPLANIESNLSFP